MQQIRVNKTNYVFQLDSDLSGGYHYPTFQPLVPGTGYLKGLVWGG